LSPFQTDPADSAWTPTPVNNKAIARPTYFIGFEGLTSYLRRLVYTEDISRPLNPRLSDDVTLAAVY
jgi:hypothetical protein